MTMKRTLTIIVLSTTCLVLAGCNSSLQQPETQSSTPVGSSGGIPSIPPSTSGSESDGSEGSSSDQQAGSQSSQETGSAGMPDGTGQAGSTAMDGSVEGEQTVSDSGVSAGVEGMDGAGEASGASASDGQNSGSMAGAGGMTGSIGGQEMGSNGTGSGGLDDDFNKSLGDFDEAMGREQAGTQGSAGATEQREAADEKAVQTAGMKGGSIGGMDNAGGMSGSTSNGGMSGGATGQSGSSQSGGADPSGSGPAGEESGEGAGEGAGRSAPDDEKVANLPDDITVDESAEDQVARQIREAAMVEEDAVIREALWDEYRKHMGMK